jgi:predicted nucleic acid-binding protein
MTIDANIVIAYLAGETVVTKTLSAWKKAGKPLFLSTVAETEVLSFDDWTEEERFDTEKFLEENFASIPFDRHLCRIAARLRRSVKIKFPDAAIAATSLFTQTPLITRNQKDFKKITTLRIVAI